LPGTLPRPSAFCQRLGGTVEVAQPAPSVGPGPAAAPAPMAPGARWTVATDAPGIALRGTLRYTGRMHDPVHLEPARPDDATAMLAVHRAAIRGTAAAAYPPEVIEAWAPLPITPAHIDGLAQRLASGTEHAVLARDAAGHVVGFGSIIPSTCELRALYVAPEHGRRGVGAMILAHLEAMAVALGLPELQMDASTNAVAFYRRHAFAAEGAGEHMLASARRMDCVRMRKPLGG
jgi:putative acetyltransferase